jgi:hypothetical protein
VPGQLTSAVPTADGGIAAAERDAVVSVDPAGARRVLTRTAGVPFRLAADAAGGVTYLERTGADRSAARRVVTATRAVTTVASGALSGLDVTSATGGRVFVTGTATSVATRAPAAGVTVVAAPAGATISSTGRLAVTSVRRADGADPRSAASDPAAARPLRIEGTALTTGRTVLLGVTPTPAGAAGSARSPLGGAATTAGRPGTPAVPTAPRTDASPTGPADLADRYCSVPRNDPANQAMQPMPRQVEWAVDQAVRGVLNVSRPANWKNLGMPAYTTGSLFPTATPIGGGGYVPAQVMLGIAAQESNLWQAARFAVPGVTANPLIGNYYGLDLYNSSTADDWTIHWGEADCGYGIMQITDHMRLAGREKGPEDAAWPYQKQRAVALDFTVNVAAGLQILKDKWNQTRAAGLTINNGDSARIENWFYAVWAYNTGFYPNTGSGPYGVGRG